MGTENALTRVQDLLDTIMQIIHLGFPDITFSTIHLHQREEAAI